MSGAPRLPIGSLGGNAAVVADPLRHIRPRKTNPRKSRPVSVARPQAQGKTWKNRPVRLTTVEKGQGGEESEGRPIETMAGVAVVKKQRPLGESPPVRHCTRPDSMG